MGRVQNFGSYLLTNDRPSSSSQEGLDKCTYSERLPAPPHPAVFTEGSNKILLKGGIIAEAW